ncbi:MAG: hypothetical protein H7A00_07270 [Hahellaceae bacterium]|nr:hypothetical protein [Hahellaceae bacterium]
MKINGWLNLYRIGVMVGGLLSVSVATADSNGNQARIGLIYLPYVDARPDIDPDELNGGVLFSHDLDEGTGYGVRFSWLDDRYSSTGVMSLAYYQGRQNEPGGDSDVRSHSFYLEGGQELKARLTDNLITYGGFVLGAGIVKFDFRHNTTQEWGGALEAGLLLGVKVANAINIGVAGKLYGWGYPTETIGDGALLEGSMSWEF